MVESDTVVHRRSTSYYVLAVGLFLGNFVLLDTSWRGTAELHTLMELAATLLVLIVGLLGLVRFYARKSADFLYLGTGFLGAAFLDGYHAIVTSTFFKEFLPSGLPSLIPWSWVASRLFLSVFLWLSVLVWQRDQRGDGRGLPPNEAMIYVWAAVATVGSFLFFAFAPLPPAHYPQLATPRPEEFVPALFFLLALVGYLRKGHWRHNAFEHWLVLSIIVNLMAQVMYMSFSGGLFDVMFDAAHLLKIVSYVLVLVGLLIGMHALFVQAEDAARDREGQLAEIGRIADERSRLLEEAERSASEREGLLAQKDGLLHRMEQTDREREALYRGVRETIGNLTSASSEILATSTQQTVAARQQASSVSESSASVEEIAVAAEQAAQRAESVAESARQADEVSQSGRQAVIDTIEAMQGVRRMVESTAQDIRALSERAEAIGGIIASVDDLGDQTKLLALNAAIEAARAGESGRGFSVVASEIQSLAEQSKKASSRIGQILGEIQKATGAAVMSTRKGTESVSEAETVMRRAEQTIEALTRAIGEAASAADQIATSADQQTCDVQRVRESMTRIDATALQMLAATRQTEELARNLDRLGTGLRGLIQSES